MEAVALNPGFWKGRRVFLTGHTGFKGAWLTLWLQKVGAGVTAFSLSPPTLPNLFEAAQAARGITSIHGDIRDYDTLAAALRDSGASIVFHLAAQATVADGYRFARDTFATNVTGTLNLLDAMRDCPALEAAVIVTSDKCYAPSPIGESLREADPLGGKDPYSASKSCAEIATASWRESFFNTGSSPRIATARAGNVIGGGDWAAHRLLPDIVRAFHAGEALSLRMPGAVRPWQHVLEALAGYLLLAEHLCGKEGARFAQGWNFGPAEADHLTVGEVAERCARLWGENARVEMAKANFQKETETLRLDAGHARQALGWNPRWNAEEALRRTLDWYRAWHHDTGDSERIRALTLAQIDDYAATT
ncbi:MAG: CDP-glucose 4,6-dehydratase [Sulfuritalea sp.]|nr:CDP-glucose 4,6-dehydratase [Sulfuritalea sp.]